MQLMQGCQMWSHAVRGDQQFRVHERDLHRHSSAWLILSAILWQSLHAQIDQYGFFGADTNIAAIHGPIANNRYFQKFKFCFLLHYQKI